MVGGDKLVRTTQLRLLVLVMLERGVERQEMNQILLVAQISKYQLEVSSVTLRSERSKNGTKLNILISKVRKMNMHITEFIRFVKFEGWKLEFRKPHKSSLDTVHIR